MKDNMTYKKIVRIKDVDVVFWLFKMIGAGNTDACKDALLSHTLCGEDYWTLTASVPEEKGRSQIMLTVSSFTPRSIKIVMEELTRAVEMRLEYPLQQEFIDEGFEVQ